MLSLERTFPMLGNCLYMLCGADPPVADLKALEVYMILKIGIWTEYINIHLRCYYLNAI